MAVNHKMSDLERHELIKKLSKETEDFLHKTQEKNKGYKYKDGFTDDNINEILATHPAFMKNQPTAEDIESNPLLQALQQIQYDPDDTPYEKAMAYKNDGNFQFKCKKYKLACAAYTEALRMKCTDKELLTILYSNRAAANFYLKNFRSSLIDASEAVKLTPNRVKSLLRCAQCCEALKRYPDAIAWCKVILSLENDHTIAKNLLDSCSKEQKIHERNVRKIALKKEKERKKNDALLEAIKLRNINLKMVKTVSDSDSEDENILERYRNVPNQLSKIQLDENGILVWPVLLLYPEFQTSDFIQAFHEDATFYSLLENMFAEQPEWDNLHHYKPNELRVFYECIEMQTLHEVLLNKTLGEILSHSTYLVQEATPNFIVLSNASEFCVQFLSKWKHIEKR